jgi:hypothetical protein
LLTGLQVQNPLANPHLSVTFAKIIVHLSVSQGGCPIISCGIFRGEDLKMGVFGAYTRWAVVFLIIFVLFFLLCPGYGYGGAATNVAVTHYGAATYPAGSYMKPVGFMGSPSSPMMGEYGSPSSS